MPARNERLGTRDGSPGGGIECGGGRVPGPAQSSVMLYNMLAKSILSKLFRSTF